MATLVDESRVCQGQPLTDQVGGPCSLCRHTPHPWMRCLNCVLEQKIEQIDELIRRYSERLS